MGGGQAEQRIRLATLAHAQVGDGVLAARVQQRLEVAVVQVGVDRAGLGRRYSRCRPTARLTAMVLLPTPPLLENTATTWPVASRAVAAADPRPRAVGGVRASRAAENRLGAMQQLFGPERFGDALPAKGRLRQVEVLLAGAIGGHQPQHGLQSASVRAEMIVLAARPRAGRRRRRRSRCAAGRGSCAHRPTSRRWRSPRRRPTAFRRGRRCASSRVRIKTARALTVLIGLHVRRHIPDAQVRVVLGPREENRQAAAVLSARTLQTVTRGWQRGHQ